MNKWARLESREFDNGNAEYCRRERRESWEVANLFQFYRGLEPDEIRRAEATFGLRVPEALRDFYRSTNGADFFGVLSISGFVEGLTRDPTPGMGQPGSLEYGNTVLGRPAGLRDNDFVLGSIIGWSLVAPVVTDGAMVRLVHPTDESRAPVLWPSFEKFLFGEFDRLAAFHDEDAQFTGQKSDLFPAAASGWDDVDD